jgi:hypothetical protein
MATTLVLCGETDLAALWAWRELRGRGIAPLELITAGALANALRWRHELGNNEPDFEIALADGRVLRRREIGGVLNRLTHVPLSAVAVAPAERAYAEQEWRAFFVSWLHALPGPTLNRATVRGLSGAIRDKSDWLSLAAQAGLPFAPTRFSHPAAQEPQWKTRFSATVVGRNVLGLPSRDEWWASACVRLAEAAGCGLLGLEFGLSADGRWEFNNATPLPELISGGAPLLDLLVAELAG